MELSKRLQAVADYVTKGNRVADIGCDHAYISIYLIDKKIAPKVVAMDVNQGPLDRAIDNIIKYGYEDVIDVRKSDGIKKLEVGEVDTLLIAGMGGGLMLQILSARMDILQSVKELVLQPQSEVYLVRQTLVEMGFVIVAENMVIDEGKYYVCMKAIPIAEAIDIKPYELTNEEAISFGKLLLEQKHPVLLQFLKKEIAQYKVIRQALEGNLTEKAQQRRKEIEKEMEVINKAIAYFNE